MKIILQAIKALFRKVENAIEKIPKNLNDILRIIGNEKIPAQSVEGMYYSVPSTISDIFKEQAVETKELTTDDRYVRTDSIPTYGVDIPNFIAANYGITEDSFGQTFTVVWDGVEYECVAHDETRYEMYTLGNPSIVNAKKDDTGEPFCILIDMWWGTDALYIRTNEIASEHTVAFGKPIKRGKLEKMPKKYMPEHNHGVTPIKMGGTGAATKEGALTNLGLDVIPRFTTYFVYDICALSGARESAWVKDDFSNTTKGSLVILVANDNIISDYTIWDVKFSSGKGVTIPIKHNLNKGYFWFIKSNAQRALVLCYDGAYFHPIAFSADIPTE